jgi:hypothetical protein
MSQLNGLLPKLLSVMLIIVLISGLCYWNTHYRHYYDSYSVTALEKQQHVTIVDSGAKNTFSTDDNTEIFFNKGDHSYYEFRNVKYKLGNSIDIHDDGILVFTDGTMSLYKSVNGVLKPLSDK